MTRKYCCVKEEEKKDESSSETGVYTRRWFILAATCLVTALTIFGSKSFVVANKIYASFFDVSLTVLDWSCLALNAGAVLVTPFFAWLFYKKSVGFRMLNIVGTGALLISYFVIVLSIEFPALFPFMIVSNFLQGVAYTVYFTVGTSFAVLWFPDHQVGLAIASNAVSFSLGTLSGAMIPPTILENVNGLVNVSNLTSIEIEDLKDLARVDLFNIYAPAFGLLVFLLLFFFVFVSDLPPKPPTMALLLKRKLESAEAGREDRSFSDFLATIKTLFQDRDFVLCCLAISIVYNIVSVEIVHITDIVAELNKRIHIHLPNDVTGGAIITGYSVTCCISAFASAQVLSKLKCFYKQTLVGILFAFLSSVGMTLCIYTELFVGFCMSIFLYGVSTRVFLIPLLEIITRHTYPLDETFVSVWVSVCGCIAQVVFVELARLISFYTPSIGLLIFMCACLFVSLLVMLCVKPTNKRGEVFDESKSEVPDENTKLIQKK